MAEPATVSRHWLEQRQRILQKEKQKISIRLEEEFWRQLEAIAAEDGRRLSDLVFELVGPERAPKNRTSLLRTYCLRWVRQRLSQAQHAMATDDFQSVFAACPGAAVVLTPDRRIAAYNKAFASQVLEQFAQAHKQSGASLSFRLSKPLEQVYAALSAPGTQTDSAKVAFVMGDRMVRMNGSFCHLRRSQADQSPLVCFLTNS